MLHRLSCLDCRSAYDIHSLAHLLSSRYILDFRDDLYDRGLDG
jgi:hypothetical protein